MTWAKKRLFLSAALSRRLYNSDAYNLPSRFLDEVPEHLVERLNGLDSRWGAAGSGQRAAQNHRTSMLGALPVPSDTGYEPEEPFVDHLQVGMRVRHPDWGIGTIKERIGEGDDLKIVVTFAGVGRKKLAPQYVHLERA